jgi:hypothetical protein
MTVKLSNINFTHINQRKGFKSKNLSQYFQIALKAKSNDESTEQISLNLCVFSIRSAVGKKGYIFICFDKNIPIDITRRKGVFLTYLKYVLHDCFCLRVYDVDNPFVLVFVYLR